MTSAATTLMPEAHPDAGMTDTHGSIDLDFLKVKWAVEDGGVTVSLKVGFKGLSWSDSVTLSIYHPSVTLSTPKVAGVYAKITLSLHDDTGHLKVEAEAHWWLIHKHEKSVHATVTVLPPFIFGLIGIGAKFPQVLKYAPQIARAAVSYKKVLAFEGAFADACREGVSAKALTGFMGIAGGHLFDGIVRLVPDEDKARAQLGSLRPSALATAIQAVVNDPRIQAVYPGIQHRFVAGADEDEGALEPGARAVGADLEKIILEIIAGLVVLAGLGATALGALASIIGLILAVVAAAPAVFTITLILAAVGIVLCVAVVALMAVAAVLVLGALAIGLVINLRSDELAAAVA